MLNRLCATNDAATDKGRLAILRGMAEALHKTGNSVLLDTHAQKTALRLGVPPEAVRAEFRKNSSEKFASAENEFESEISADQETPRPLLLEFYLLKLLLLHDELAGWTALHLDVNWILHPLVRQIVADRLAALTNETWQSVGAFLDGFESAEIRSLITEAVAEERKIPNPETQLADLTLKLRNQFYDRQLTASILHAARPQITDAEKIDLLRQQQELRRLKRAPLQQLPE